MKLLILAEPPLPRRPSPLSRLLDWLRPRRVQMRLRNRLREEQSARAEVEQSNLALRRKCADLKAQLRAAQKSVEQLEANLRMRN